MREGEKEKGGREKGGREGGREEERERREVGGGREERRLSKARGGINIKLFSSFSLFHLEYVVVNINTLKGLLIKHYSTQVSY